MSGNYSDSRHSLFAKARQEFGSITDGSLWSLGPEALRFRLGESVADLKVPFHLGAQDEDILEKAVLGLATLLKKRFEPHEETAQRQGMIHSIIAEPTTSLADRNYRTDMFIEGSLERHLSAEVLRAAPLMDGAILAAWLGPKGHGKRFIAWIGTVMEKALREETKLETRELTSYLALLAIIKVLMKKKGLIKDIKVKGVSYERMDLAVGFTLHLSVLTAIEDMLKRLKKNGVRCEGGAGTRLLASITPHAFLLIPSNLLSSSVNPYQIRQEIADAIEKHASEITDETDLESLLASTEDKIKDNRQAPNLIREQHTAITLRRWIIDYLMDFDLHGTEEHKPFYDLCREDRLNHISSHKTIEQIDSALDGIMTRHAKDFKRIERIEAFRSVLSPFKKKGIGAWFSSRPEKDDPESLMPVLRDYYAWKADELAERYVAISRSYLLDRREKFAQGLLIEENEAGRLYRFSEDQRPILKTLTVEKEGHLFLDMKDFTTKTLKLKEIAMAEFMKSRFYEPILDAASQYIGGMDLAGGEEKGIRLNSLPGDAAVFSGGMASLVALASDIKRLIRHYNSEVKKRLSTLLEKKTTDTTACPQVPSVKTTKETEGLIDFDEKELTERLYKEDIENAIKEEMEAGLFIAYGAMAETMVIEPKKDFTGTFKVAIGEKINEAARGTDRKKSVFLSLEALIEAERKKRGRRIRYPFDIYIERTYDIHLAADMSKELEAMVYEGKKVDIQSLFEGLKDDYVADIEKIKLGVPYSALKTISISTDIYNKGQALSHEALDAYIKETKGRKFFFKKAISVQDLDPSLRDSFFFPQPSLEFWFSVELVRGSEQIEAFYKTGEVVFKGFESKRPTVVYEMLDPDGEFFRTLISRHFKEWHEETKF
ncbi:MAG: hypothetical protein HY880_04095 [Deltaproteobacteria bacterium]|nr:hypothetical protein [Deltaproteobacteria bacterium]